MGQELPQHRWDRSATPELSLPPAGNSGSLPNPFTVATWNIERGKRMGSVARFLQTELRADLLLLQEVDRFARRTRFCDVASELGKETQMQYVFGVEFVELAQGRGETLALHGNMILSRSRLNRPRNIRFLTQPHNWGRSRIKIPWLQPRDGGRAVLSVELLCNEATVAIYNTHLESRTNDEQRAEQVAEILCDIHRNYSPTTPVIVAGDLNTAEGVFSPVVERLLNAGFRDVFCSSSAPSTSKPGRQRRLDWMFVRSIDVLNACMPCAHISDHYPIFAQLRLSGPVQP